MKPARCSSRFPGRVAPSWRPFRVVGVYLPGLEAHSSAHYKQLSSHHRHIAQGKQRNERCHFFCPPFLAHLGEAKLILDGSKRVQHLDPRACLVLLGVVQQSSHFGLSIHCTAFDRAHRHMPAHALGFKPFFRPVLAPVSKHHGFLSVQQAAPLWITSLTLAAVR